LVRICFVCLGNICRSPIAEGVMRHLVGDAGLARSIEVESAGTASYHAGEAADRRARQAAERRGIALRGRARQFKRADWDKFDYVLAMDLTNLRDLQESAPSHDHLKKLKLLREFDSEAPPGASVPDPYYGDDDGFDEVLDICQSACEKLLAHVRREHGL
jgi:protein-tyrosine phosphatase